MMIREGTRRRDGDTEREGREAQPGSAQPGSADLQIRLYVFWWCYGFGVGHGVLQRAALSSTPCQGARGMLEWHSVFLTESPPHAWPRGVGFLLSVGDLNAGAPGADTRPAFRLQFSSTGLSIP